MIANMSLKKMGCLILPLLLIANQAVATDLSNVPLNTYTATSATDVKPNVLFILDDSGSMDWDYLPDWANDNSPPNYFFKNSSFNGVAYNPAIKYDTPITFNADGTKNTTTYPSMTGVSTATGGDASASTSSPNWKAVKNDGFGVQSTSTTNLVDNAYAYTSIPGEYCAAASLRTCTPATAATTISGVSYSIPSVLRWCDSSALTSCKATNDGTYSFARMAAPRIATITINGSASTSVSSITVGGKEIMSASVGASTSSSALAASIATQINACSNGKPASTNCQVVGYTATSSGNLVLIYAPDANSDTPVVTRSASTMLIASTTFGRRSVATIRVSGSNSTSVSSVTVNSAKIASASTTASTSSSTVAQLIADQINLCTGVATGICTVNGYAASVSGSTVTIYAPASAGAISHMPAVIQSGTMTISPTAFSYAPGENLRTTITSSVTSYAYPGSASKGTKRTDCAGTTCTYAEEMTNYANWWAYHHTRMQMMKTASSNAFSTLDTTLDQTNNVSRFRVGFMTISNGNTDSKFRNLAEFKTSQKSNWYNDLLGANPSSSTPLRGALSRAGQLYAGKLNGKSINGTTVSDPLQYSCQQNYTILSTDGFWNTNDESSTYGPYAMDGTTEVGNRDAALPRPLADGASVSITARTSALQQRIKQQNAERGVLQTRTGPLQGTRSKVLMKCNGSAAVCGTAPATGVPDAFWNVLASGTCTTSSTTQCAVISGLSGNVNAATRCNTAASITSVTTTGSIVITVSGVTASTRLSSLKVDGVEVLTGTTSSFNNNSNSKVAANIASKVGANGYTATVSSAIVTLKNTTITAASSISYTVSVGAATLTAGTITVGSTTYTLNNADTNGNVYSACSYNWAPWANASAACTVNKSSASPYTILNGTDCQYLFAASAGTQTCTPSYVAGNYTNLSAYRNCATTTGSWANAPSCTVTPIDINGTTTECQYTAWTAYSSVGSCTPVAQSVAPNYTVATARQCSSTSSGGTDNTLADVAAYYYDTDLRSSVAADGTGTCVGPVIAPSTTANDLCNNNVRTSGKDVAETQHMTTFTLGLGAQGAMVFSSTYVNDQSGDYYDVLKGTTANPANGICAWQSSGACNWPVPASGSLTNIDDLWHAALNGRASYFSATDPSTLSEGLTVTLRTIINTPKPGTAAAAASSNPNISSSDNYVFSSSYKSIDWYGELIRQQLSATTATLTPAQWSSMTLLDCATTPWTASTSYLVGQTYQESSKCYMVAVAYTSGSSFGTVDTDNTAVVVDPSAVPVTAKNGRTIYTKSDSGNSLISFAWGNLSATQKAYFTEPYIAYVPATSWGLSQFCATGACLTAAEQTNNTIATGGAAGEALVNFLRGDRGYEGAYFRTRTHVLGDIVSSEGRYVKQPLFSYVDVGYSDFKAGKASRKGMVYVAANDGMLHAFDASTGQENWAYIPEIILPELFMLADKNYAMQHRYFVDGTPEVGEYCPTAPSATCDATQWKTMLIGGLNLGGKGYYALDITDPDNPTVMWEINNTMTGFTDLGYTYGNPKLTKLKDGRWVVVFASGYNSGSNDTLFVVNATDGSLIRKISTGLTAGVARIAAHAPQAVTDNMTVAVYGGDLLGNLWRFDINGDIGTAGYDAQKLIQLKDASGNPQPITAKPTVSSVGGNTVVFIGTGQYLGISDLTNTQFQSFYAIKDKMDSATYGNPRTGVTPTVFLSSTGFVHQTLKSETCPTGAATTICSPGQVVRTVTSNPVDWSSNSGWYLDFLTGGERSATDSSLGIGTLVFTTITPQGNYADACTSSSGTTASFSCAIDYMTGGAVSNSSGVACASLGAGVATRPVLVELSDGTVVSLVRMSGGADDSAPPTAGGETTGGTDMGDTKIVFPPVKPLTAGGTRRTSWRKLNM